jgi:hypothetical protein
MTEYEFVDSFSFDRHTSSPNTICQFYYEVNKPQDHFCLPMSPTLHPSDHLLRFMVTCSILTITISKNREPGVCDNDRGKKEDHPSLSL